MSFSQSGIQFKGRPLKGAKKMNQMIITQNRKPAAGNNVPLHFCRRNRGSLRLQKIHNYFGELLRYVVHRIVTLTFKHEESTVWQSTH